MDSLFFDRASNGGIFLGLFELFAQTRKQPTGGVCFSQSAFDHLQPFFGDLDFTSWIQCCGFIGLLVEEFYRSAISDPNKIFIIDKFISSDLSPFLAFFAVFDFTFDLNQHSRRLSLGREVLDRHHQSKKDE